jgi:methylmalonyl-CoA/ethylmalonyl-CoA epimerase
MIMIPLLNFAHICVVVDDIENAGAFYESTLGATAHYDLVRCKNVGLAKGAGFLVNPETIELSVRFMRIPMVQLNLELIQFHTPADGELAVNQRAHDRGLRHICLRVKDVDTTFQYLKTCDGIRMINQSPEYRPSQLDAVSPDQVRIFGNGGDLAAYCRAAASVKFFYCIDPYGVQWEFYEDVKA